MAVCVTLSRFKMEKNITCFSASRPIRYFWDEDCNWHWCIFTDASVLSICYH